MNSGILTAAHNDRNDGYGGVIVINKKHLVTEDNHFKFTGGNIVSIKIETLKKKTVIFCACYRSPNNGNTSNDSLISNLLAIRKKIQK